jgi:hypothetical protein
MGVATYGETVRARGMSLEEQKELALRRALCTSASDGCDHSRLRRCRYARRSATRGSLFRRGSKQPPHTVFIYTGCSRLLVPTESMWVYLLGFSIICSVF